MLVVKRSEGQWTEVTHKASGVSFKFRVYDIKQGSCESGNRPGTVNIAFEDDEENYYFNRPERKETVFSYE